MKYDVIVIGSGPAGLAAGFAAADSGKKVLILEKMHTPGLKLLASGGGKCNVTNTLPPEEFARRFGRNWRFLLPTLENFHGEKLLDFFKKHHLPLKLTDGFHYFPATEKARDVLELFTGEIVRRGGGIRCNTKVLELDYRSKQVITDRGTFSAGKIVCACGGRGYPALGGSMAGYELAEKCGHRITPLYPEMTGLICRDEKVRECTGISLPDCRTKIGVKGANGLFSGGELLFTHNGFSAFAILDLAGTVAKLLEDMPEVPLKIDFLPGTGEDELFSIFDRWRKNGGTRKISTLLSEMLPRRVAQMLLDGDDPEISRWTAASSRLLAAKLKNSVFPISGVEDWPKAMVTRGGVSLKDISPHTLESKITPGIFFAGEMLDVTGPCGGFNITWALASGMLAGK
ncbi:MAG: aminoacetone oxidase family FAD-binding enzyme [Lentisphaeria bacterium]|nr:aminoacetone oxidase family FAD-binding enzyme [Lentisphaeria bacterium]